MWMLCWSAIWPSVKKSALMSGKKIENWFQGMNICIEIKGNYFEKKYTFTYCRFLVLKNLQSDHRTSKFHAQLIHQKITVLNLMTIFVSSLAILCHKSRTYFQLCVINNMRQICFLDSWDAISHRAFVKQNILTSYCLLIIFLHQISILHGIAWQSYGVRILHNNYFHQLTSKTLLCQSSDNVS